MASLEVKAPVSTAVGGIDSDTLRRALALIRALRDPALPGLVFLPLVALIGCAALVVALVGTAGTPYVALQLPYVVSGGFGGVALVVIGALLTAVQAERRDRVAATVDMRDMVTEVCALTSAARRRYRS